MVVHRTKRLIVVLVIIIVLLSVAKFQTKRKTEQKSPESAPNGPSTSPAAVITPYQSTDSASPKYVMVEIDGREFSVEVARTEEEINEGLSNRRETGSDGMLFIIDPPRIPSFWMKGMNFPLDIIWIRNGKVIKIDHDVPAPSANQNPSTFPTYQPPATVDRVLELPAGVAARYGLKTGSFVSVEK
jgi:uncharacterized membrane protein (UPF0127 family)